MKVIIADEAGFCFGVKRALKIINELHDRGKDVQIYGQLIHNKIVLNDLAEKGIHCIDSMDECARDKVLVIRTHGIPLKIEDELKEKRIHYIDATCPLVKKTHKIIKKLNRQKTFTVIVGDKDHPEIMATKSYSVNAIVINSEVEAQQLKQKDKISVIAQTTLDADFFKRIVSILMEKAKSVEIFNTICNATRDRQAAIKKLAPEVDFMVVIGGKNSSNTKKLYDISMSKNKHTFYFERSSELKRAGFQKQVSHFRTAGIAAGASTPYEEMENAKRCLETKS